MKKFKRIWKELRGQYSMIPLNEAAFAKKILGYACVILLALFILLLITPLSVFAFPFLILLLVCFSKFTIASNIVKNFESCYCKACNELLDFDCNKNVTFKKIFETKRTNSVSTGKKATGNLIVENKGDHYKVSAETVNTYQTHHIGWDVTVEYVCKCQKCGTENARRISVFVSDPSNEEKIRKSLQFQLEKTKKSVEELSAAQGTW